MRVTESHYTSVDGSHENTNIHLKTHATRDQVRAMMNHLPDCMIHVSIHTEFSSDEMREFIVHTTKAGTELSVRSEASLV